MQYYLAFIVFFSIWYLSINAQSGNNSTVHVVVQNGTVVETTFVSNNGHANVTQTIMSSGMNTTTNSPNKVFSHSYVEPPPHPLGYCIRSRIRCSKIRRCCKAPCNINTMHCP